MQIGAANTASLDCDEDLASSRLRNRLLAQYERCFRLVQNHRAHRWHDGCLRLKAGSSIPRFQLARKAFTSR
jgi:hypothetical protein